MNTDIDLSQSSSPATVDEDWGQRGKIRVKVRVDAVDAVDADQGDTVFYDGSVYECEGMGRTWTENGSKRAYIYLEPIQPEEVEEERFWTTFPTHAFHPDRAPAKGRVLFLDGQWVYSLGSYYFRCDDCDKRLSNFFSRCPSCQGWPTTKGNCSILVKVRPATDEEIRDRSTRRRAKIQWLGRSSRPDLSVPETSEPDELSDDEINRFLDLKQEWGQRKRDVPSDSEDYSLSHLHPNDIDYEARIDDEMVLRDDGSIVVFYDDRVRFSPPGMEESFREMEEIYSSYDEIRSRVFDVVDSLSELY